MNENVEKLALEIVNPIKHIIANYQKNCSMGPSYPPGWYTGIYWRKPAFKKLSKDKGFVKYLLFIYNHPYQFRYEILDYLDGRSGDGEYFQHYLKAELVIWSKKRGYEITPLGVALLKYFNLI